MRAILEGFTRKEKKEENSCLPLYWSDDTAASNSTFFRITGRIVIVPVPNGN